MLFVIVGIAYSSHDGTRVLFGANNVDVDNDSFIMHVYASGCRLNENYKRLWYSTFDAFLIYSCCFLIRTQRYITLTGESIQIKKMLPSVSDEHEHRYTLVSDMVIMRSYFSASHAGIQNTVIFACKCPMFTL